MGDVIKVRCICGKTMVNGEAEIETSSGIKMLVPALICLNDNCEADFGFIVKEEVLKSADYWANKGDKEYNGLVNFERN